MGDGLCRHVGRAGCLVGPHQGLGDGRLLGLGQQLEAAETAGPASAWQACDGLPLPGQASLCGAMGGWRAYITESVMNLMFLVM